MKYSNKITAALITMTSMSAWGDSSVWNNSPYNYANSLYNYANSPSNYNNSPSNWENNPANISSNRIVRDNSGHPMGYAVPKPDGGVNFFDLQGHREGYEPPDE